MDSRPPNGHHEGWFHGPARGRGLTAGLERLVALRRRKRVAPLPTPSVADGEAAVPAVSLGAKVAQARHESRLTSKQLAERLDLPLWTTERIERDEADATPHLAAIARVTERPEAWFADAVTPAPTNGRAPRAPPRTDAGAGDVVSMTEPVPLLVLGSLILLVTIRLFTELVPVLPRAANLIDIPMFGVLLVASFLRPEGSVRSRRVGFTLAIAFLFVVMCAISTMTNLSRVDLAPALVFVYGLAGPIGIYYAVHRLWPVGSARTVSRLLVALGVLQLAIVFLVNLPEYILTQDPDVISGTFGENAYQLVFFLLVLTGLLSAIFTFEKQRAIARVVPVMLLAIMVAIFLAQFRSLLLTTALTVLLLSGLLGLTRIRGALIGALAVVTLLVTLAYVAQNLPALKFGSVLEETRANPTLYFKERLSTVSVLGRMFGDEPRFTATGSGPGTYSSRAWRTFAQTSDSDSDVTGDYVAKLTNGRPYRSDVAEKYVQPQLRNSEAINGSFAVTSPFSSYLSVSAELGLIGVALIVVLYVWAFWSSLRMTFASIRGAKDGDSLPGLLCASTVAFFVLLQMALLENWMEVTRITFFSWMLFAIATKEFEGRARDA